MSSRIHRKRTRGDNGMLLLGAVCVITLIIALRQLLPAGPLSEARFADRSTGGLYIVPASCPSDPPIAIEQGPLGPISWEVVSGLAGGEVVKFNPNTLLVEWNFCVANSSGNNYFLPGRTQAEIRSFANYPPLGVSVYDVPVP